MCDVRKDLMRYRLEMAGSYKDSIFDKKFSKYISQAFQIRNNTDYADFFLVSKQDAREQYERAEEFLAAVECFIDNEMQSMND